MTNVVSSQLKDGHEPDLANLELDFLWLELTNRCNLRCVHCYTESSPNTGDRDLLTRSDYLRVMNQAYALGCRKLQFIGGEPQLSPDFQILLEASKSIGFEFIEVFTNLTRLDEVTLQFARTAGIHFATSVYSDNPEGHRRVTRNQTSHRHTVRNIERLVENGVPLRAAVIQVDQTAAEIERTKKFLAGLGVERVRSSRVRAFGRGEELLSLPQSTQMSELCGHCWTGRLCVAPDGEVYPCVMARQWSVGNVRSEELASIATGISLRTIRAEIYRTVWRPKRSSAGNANNHSTEHPLEDDSGRRAQESEKENPEPACPQSCDPSACPQSCTPTCDPADGCLPQEHPQRKSPPEE